MASTLQRTWWLGLLLPLLAGCAGVPARVESGGPTLVESRPSPRTARAIDLVVDGAGGYQNAPRSLAAVADDLRLPLYVRSFDWSHGRGGRGGLADMIDQPWSRCQGLELAQEIEYYRQTQPGISVSVVAFSAGAAVALAAADHLAADSLERLVLLAPAVSPGYDLRRALACSRQGVDVFSSERDRVWLGLGTRLIGTADGRHEPAAGRSGFAPPALSPAEVALAARFHQHPWNSCVSWTGNQGGHTGSLSPAFLKAYVLPLLLPA